MPSGLVAMACGFFPTTIGAPAVSLVRSISVTLPVVDGPEMVSATYAVVGCAGEIAMEIGPPCTEMGDPALSLARSIGDTLPELVFATSAVEPSGVMAMAVGAFPTVIASRAFPVVRSTGVTVDAMFPVWPGTNAPASAT